MFYLDGSTIGWIIVMSLLFLVALGFVCFSKTEYKGRIIGSFPTIASTIGVFGTFWGITSGLMGFDPTNLDASIPVLLSGLKTAFITSLLGMSFSVILRWILDHRLDKNQTYTPTPTDVAIGDILAELKMQTGYAQRNHKMLSDHQNDAQDLFSQLEKVLEKLESFEQTLAKSNSEVLAKAMEDATAEFSRKMNDVVERLVKENFDQLNKSVENLNTWQKENKEAMESLREAHQQARESLAETSKHIKEIYGKNGKVEDLITKLEESIKSLNYVGPNMQNIAATMQNAAVQMERCNQYFKGLITDKSLQNLMYEERLNVVLKNLEACLIKVLN